MVSVKLFSVWLYDCLVRWLVIITYKNNDKEGCCASVVRTGSINKFYTFC